MRDRSSGTGPLRLRRGQTLTLVVIGVVALALLGSLCWHLERAERTRLGEEARITADQVRIRLQAWIEFRISALRYAAHWRDDEGHLDEEAFRESAALLMLLHPGYQAVNWVDADGVIQIVEPLEGNEPALGRDLSQHKEPGVAEAIARARSRASTSAARTPATELLQGGWGLAVYQPVRDARGELRGFVNGVFRIDTLLNACLAEGRLQRNFRYILEEADEAIAYAHGGSHDYADWPHRADLSVRAADLDWRLHLAPSEARLEEVASSAPVLVFVGGFLGTVLILWLLRGRQLRREALLRSEALYRSLISDVLDASRVGIIILDAARRVVWLNEAFATYFGLPARELVGADMRTVVRERLPGGIIEDSEAFAKHVLAGASAEARPYEFHVLPGGQRKDRWLEHRSQPIESGLFAGGRIDHFYDVTLRKEAAAEQTRLVRREGELQDQLRQAQRMEAVGKLAGGVAHDFNNILQVTLGRAHQLLAHAPVGSRDAGSLTEIVEASEKAADLTRQLLAFGRRQRLERRLLEPSRLVRDHVKLLRRLIGEHIELDLQLSEDVGRLRADKTQLEQVLMNLCVNARDAMPDGGRITISTAACREEPVPRAADANGTEVRPPESYVKITVSDTGAGIPEADLDRVCEPFFSTKAPGRGSGLGLSTVHGIVHQHDGFMEIESVVGEGTSISAYLPSVDETETEEVITPSESPTDGAETILVVEDEPNVRSLAVEALEYGGYTVRTATNGVEALEVLLAEADSIDLVFSDVVMPEMGGVALVEAVRARGLYLPMLLTSGYGEEILSPSLDASVLPKPYSPGVMLQRIREVLDAGSNGKRTAASSLPSDHVRSM